MPRPFFPHTLDDVTRAIDGPFGLVVGDMPDGALFVLKRERARIGAPPAEGGPAYELAHYADAARTRLVSRERIEGRAAAIDAFAARIGLDERIG
jgi:hypothetical protein